ncbi:MAG: glycoside hydrolase family 43 protein [Oscillospiraceae bacterium]|jgi:beta-xylosidase|nr:glycoside hydrolase family 43 protein [Oscillospiraceae bacterium]
MSSTFRTPLVTHIYTADPSAHVFNEKIYIYPSHDLVNEGLDDDKGDHFQMMDYHVLSLDDIGAPCVDHGEALHINDVPWASRQMWAPDAAYKNSKYYFYFPAKDKDGIFRIGAAVGDKPEGPFKAEENYIQGSFSIDPAVFIDDDGSAYMYFGGLWGGQLEKWQTGKYVEGDENMVPGSDGPQDDEAALGVMCAKMNEDMISFESKPVELKILDENGKPITAGDKDRWYFEGPWMHKFNGKYYLSYSTGPTHYLCYAESDSPTGPFTYKGRIMEPVIGWTTHHSIVEFKDKWYLFYHDSKLSGGKTHLRTVMFTELEIADDGTITTIKPYE